MANYTNDDDAGAAEAGQPHQWQGQANHYLDSSQSSYDLNNPHAWQQGSQFPGHRLQAKPAHKRWWFWAIIVVVLAGLVAIIMALLPIGNSPSDAPNAVLRMIPLDPDTADEVPEIAPQGPDGSTSEPEIRRSTDGSFELADGGTLEDALAEAQRRIDSEYMDYGPGDLIFSLRADGYQNKAIEHALNNLDVDWNTQALGIAQRMADSDHGGYSALEIQEQLENVNFNADETQYALDNLDVDYNDQALQALESYLDLFDDKTESEAREYLGHAGFEASEIDNAFESID